MIDQKGYRLGIGMVIVNDDDKVFFARRVNKRNAWQFPQGGLLDNEIPEKAMFRELYEEIGLSQKDVKILNCSEKWITYDLPSEMIRYRSEPVCIGQKQKWYLLRLENVNCKIQFDLTNFPEFNGFRWVDYWLPINKVISFKKDVYRQVLKEFSPTLFDR